MSKITDAYEILKNYNGKNNQIKYFKKLHENGKLILNDFITQYILHNHDFEPLEVNKNVKISTELGEFLCKEFNLTLIPNQIRITKIIGEMGGSYHCYIKTKVAGEVLIYIKKRYILDKLNTIDYDSIFIDFDYFDNMETNKGRKLKEHQKIGAKFLVGNKKAILADSMGTGKMQDVDTIIPTPNGYKRFGDLSVNDEVFGSNGNIYQVVQVYPHQNKDIYEIEFNDGTVSNAGLDHLWIVKQPNEKNWYVLSLDDIVKGHLWQNKTYQIPVCSPVDYTKKDYLLDVYKLGNAIANGNVVNIPSEYKFGSIEQRKDLIKGILDINGEIDLENNYITYQTNNKTLVNDFVEIINSLGGICYVSGEIDYKISFILPFCPFNLLNKRNLFDKIKNNFEFYKTIKSIKYLKTCDAMCIKVNSPNESYLTNDYIVTHNTTTSIIAALGGGYKNILIITTASLKTNWKKDLVLYENEENIEIINGSTWKPGKKFTIINYDIIDNFYEVPMEPVYKIEEVKDVNGCVVETLKVPVMIKDKKTGKLTHKMQKSRKKKDIQESLKNSPLFLQNYDCVIIDEAQKLSNKGSIRYTAISDFLIKSSPKAIFLLTGTPLTNNPMNLYNILKLIDADVTRDYKYYVERYCGGKEHHKRDGGKYWTFDGPAHLDELREKIKDVYIRRLASETGEMVGKQIIKKYYDLNPTQKYEYDKLWEEYQNSQDDEKQEENEQYRQLIEGSLVRQFLAKEMTQNTIDMVDDYIENGEKVVIITCFQEEMDILQKYFGKHCVTYNGSMSTKQKDKAQDAFLNDDNVKVFIGQIVAASVGLSLPIAKTLIFNSFSFSSADNKQAEDRVYRLTQTHDVEIIYQLFNDTWTQEMFDKVLYKEYLSNQLIKSEINKK